MQAETRAAEAEMSRDDAEARVRLLEKKVTQLEVKMALRDDAATREIGRINAECDSNVRQMHEHAEERVKAMCSMARDSQDAMYRNMEILDEERRRLVNR